MEKPIIYQVFTRLFGNRNTTRKYNGTLLDNGCGKFADFDEKTLNRIHDLGITHIWYTGVIRHATDTDYTRFGIPKQNPRIVKGKAGSPYAITDYYDVDPDLATDVPNRMAEWEALIERTHNAGMKVIMDFVPNHVARQYQSICKPDDVHDLGEDDDTTMHFSTANNFYYCWGQAFDMSDLPKGDAQPDLFTTEYEEIPARATGNDCFSNRPGRNDWYETVKLNYGIDYCDAGGRSEHFSPIPNTWGMMTDILLFWAKKGVDAFRCDMAEMVPAAFWFWATDKVKYRYPDIKFIGEVYNPGLYRNYIGAGFDWLYDKVGMYDCVRDITCGHRRAGDITRQWQATDDIRDHMLYFLENHDEQRIASDFFAGDGFKGIPGLIVSCLLQKNPFMLYAGQEFGERGMEQEGFSGKDGRTTIFDYWSVESIRCGYFDRRKMQKSEKELSALYRKIMKIARREKAVSKGATFDLMYVNQSIADKQYVFLRKAEDELLLVAVNFDGAEANISVAIPRHAFEYMRIPEREVTATDLLTKEQLKTVLIADASVRMTIPAYSGRIYKIKC